MTEQQLIDHQATHGEAPEEIAEARAARETWAVVELMGHVKHAGRLTEEEKFGVKMGRVDVPDGEGWVTVFFGGSSVYRITVCSEQVARHVARQTTTMPVSPWDFPKPALGMREEKPPSDPQDEDYDDDTGEDSDF